MPYTEDELNEIDSQKAYWKELADACGWKIYSWSFRQHVTYWTNVNYKIEMTGDQRDDIMRAIANAKENK